MGNTGVWKKYPYTELENSRKVAITSFRATNSYTDWLSNKVKNGEREEIALSQSSKAPADVKVLLLH